MRESLRASDPRQVGRYRLERRLGSGGMGRVYLGRSPGGRPVAVKVVRPELAEDARFRERFAREVEAARKVGGFYTAQVVDADAGADPPWLVTAYVAGPSLHEAVTAHGPLPPAELAVLALGLAEGLEAIHAAGLVHRDLKPGNVVLAADGPRVIDFGIAHALDASHHSSAIVGTPAFMSPEQGRGDPVSPASDVFSFGSVLAFAATGESPFGSGPAHAVLYRIVHGEPDLSGLDASLPSGFGELIADCLDTDPDRRPSVPDLLARVSALTAESSPSASASPSTTRRLPAESDGPLSETSTSLVQPPSPLPRKEAAHTPSPPAAEPPSEDAEPLFLDRLLDEEERHRRIALLIVGLAAVLVVVSLFLPGFTDQAVHQHGVGRSGVPAATTTLEIHDSTFRVLFMGRTWSVLPGLCLLVALVGSLAALAHVPEYWALPAASTMACLAVVAGGVLLFMVQVPGTSYVPRASDRVVLDHPRTAIGLWLLMGVVVTVAVATSWFLTSTGPSRSSGLTYVLLTGAALQAVVFLLTLARFNSVEHPGAGVMLRVMDRGHPPGRGAMQLFVGEGLFYAFLAGALWLEQVSSSRTKKGARRFLALGCFGVHTVSLLVSIAATWFADSRSDVLNALAVNASMVRGAFGDHVAGTPGLASLLASALLWLTGLVAVIMLWSGRSVLVWRSDPDSGRPPERLGG
ncbi:serine/threonine protein kinase [Actinomadura logoneensis]|uniref:Serine/threonine protein kinase n=1 Tax=Actinomadura logoneensis TaxID=2293572 RepID=A0A372JP73_9ACTN|nr:serine/threonine-protein kinase [Actinomadura logoneensis]RFU41823.1 serine/threonine protein kinase [Actinomadura logoneensis]